MHCIDTEECIVIIVHIALTAHRINTKLKRHKLNTENLLHVGRELPKIDYEYKWKMSINQNILKIKLEET